MLRPARLTVREEGLMGTSRFQANTSFLSVTRPKGKRLSSAVAPENSGDVFVAAPFGPRQRRRPGVIVGKVGGRTAGEQKINHIAQMVARCPRQRCGMVLIVLRRDVRAGIEKNCGAPR